MEAVMNAETAGNPKTMGFVVSYQSSTDFYYAGAQVAQDKWVIGRYQSGTYGQSATYSETIDKNTNYTIKATVTGTTVTLYVKQSGSWVQKVSYDFGTLPAGDVGFTTESTHTTYDNFKLNAETVTCAYNTLNQLTTSNDSSTTTAYTFDADGNLASKTVGAANPTTYTYNYENMLTTVTLPAGSVTTYVYSGLSKRVKKIDASGTTQYKLDGDNILMEQDGTGTTQLTYTYNPYGLVGNILSNRNAQGSVDSYYHYDAIGNVMNLTNAQCQIQTSYEYDAFGNILSGSSAYNDINFQTKPWEGDSIGLYYSRARYYDPSIGRFTTRDPIGYEGGINLYTYAKGNPIVLIDFSGKWCVSIPFATTTQKFFIGLMKYHNVGLRENVEDVPTVVTRQDGTVSTGLKRVLCEYSADITWDGVLWTVTEQKFLCSDCSSWLYTKVVTTESSERFYKFESKQATSGWLPVQTFSLFGGSDTPHRACLRAAPPWWTAHFKGATIYVFIPYE